MTNIGARTAQHGMDSGIPSEKTGEVAEGLCGGLPGPEPAEARALSAARLTEVLPLPPSPLLLCPDAPKPPDLQQHQTHLQVYSTTRAPENATTCNCNAMAMHLHPTVTPGQHDYQMWSQVDSHSVTECFSWDGFSFLNHLQCYWDACWLYRTLACDLIRATAMSAASELYLPCCAGSILQCRAGLSATVLISVGPGLCRQTRPA